MNQKQYRKIQMNRFLTTGRDKKLILQNLCLKDFK